MSTTIAQEVGPNSKPQVVLVMTKFRAEQIYKALADYQPEDLRERNAVRDIRQTLAPLFNRGIPQFFNR